MERLREKRLRTLIIRKTDRQTMQQNADYQKCNAFLEGPQSEESNLGVEKLNRIVCYCIPKCKESYYWWKVTFRGYAIELV